MALYTVVLDDRDSDSVYDSIDCDTWPEVLEVIDRWKDDVSANVAIAVVDGKYFKGE